MSDPLVSINASETDPLVVWMVAQSAVLRVAPRAHEDVVVAVGRALVEHGTIALSLVRAIVRDKDPIARALRRQMRVPGPKASTRKMPSSKKGTTKPN